MHSTHNPSSITRNLAEKHTFSSKERDAETGLSYFGARYYSSDLSLWLSVDPMADKYPSMNPYTYCANNPVKLVDPNGKEIDPESTPLWNKMKDDSYFVVRAKTNMKYKIVKWKLYLICMLLLANICISSAQDVIFHSFYNDNLST